MRFGGNVEKSCVNCCEDGKETSTNDEIGDYTQRKDVGTSEVLRKQTRSSREENLDESG